MNGESIIAKLEAALDRLEMMADHCARQILKIDEVMQGINTIRAEVASSLPPDSPAYRTFDRLSRESNDWWEHTLSGYIAPKDCANIEKWMAILRKTIDEIEPEFLREEKREKKQHFFSVGEEYRAKKTIFKLMKRATKSLVIMDQYLDDSIFDYIESLDPTIKVQMLAGTRKPIFNQLYKTFSTNHPNVEAKEFTGFHDRFLILDETEIWHLGASINHAGKKAFMINKVTDQEQKDSIVSDYRTWWARGNIIS